MERAEDEETRQAITGQTRRTKGKRKRGTQIFNSGATDESEDDGVAQRLTHGEESDHDDEGVEGLTRSNPVVLVDSGFSTSEVTAQPKVTRISEVGSALQRNADGSVVTPRVSKRKPKGAQVRSIQTTHPKSTDIRLSVNTLFVEDQAAY